MWYIIWLCLKAALLYSFCSYESINSHFKFVQRSHMCNFTVMHHLISLAKFGFRSWPRRRWKGLKQCINLCYVSLSWFWVCTGQTGKCSHKEGARTVFALLSSAQWLMEDQKPQGGKAVGSCILFHLNINTLARQMRLRPLFAVLCSGLLRLQIAIGARKAPRLA